MPIPRVAGPAAVALLTACSAPGGSMADGPAATLPPGSRVVILGTGTPNADPDRSGPGVAIVSNGHAYLVDAGAGIVRRAVAAAMAQSDSALMAGRLDIVFLTHLHSDHTIGLPDLIFTPWVLDREAPLRVYGPPGTKAMVEHLHAAWAEDIRTRTEGLQPANATGHEIEVHEIAPGQIFDDGTVRVIAFLMKHGSMEPAYGFRIETPDRSFFISGDTGPSEAIVDGCDGCDVMVHEVYSTNGFATRPPDWQRYHSSFHTSTSELAALATRARPGRLVLYHQLYWGFDDETLIREMREAGYAGAVSSARDLDAY